jgi:hypothetical protein
VAGPTAPKAVADSARLVRPNLVAVAVAGTFPWRQSRRNEAKIGRVDPTDGFVHFLVDLPIFRCAVRFV